jgi:hypothetical protein
MPKGLSAAMGGRWVKDAAPHFLYLTGNLL